MKRAAMVLVLLLASVHVWPGQVLSYDPNLQNACVQTLIEDTGTIPSPGTLRSDCGLSTGNTVYVDSDGAWSRSDTWRPSAADLPCDSFFIDYATWMSPRFMYGEAHDCASDELYRNYALTQTTSPHGPVLGIPADVMLYDPRYPDGYTLTAQIAIPEVSTIGFVRAGLMFHVRGPGVDLFLEFDAYDNPGVFTCTDAYGRVWSAYCPDKRSVVFERHKWWGENIPLSTWTTLSVSSREVRATIAEFRPDLCLSELRIHQVYSAMELRGGYGQLQVSHIRLETN